MLCFDLNQILSAIDIQRGYLVGCARPCLRFLSRLIGVQAYSPERRGNSQCVCEQIPPAPTSTVLVLGLGKFSVFRDSLLFTRNGWVGI